MIGLMDQSTACIRALEDANSGTDGLIRVELELLGRWPRQGDWAVPSETETWPL